MYECIYCIKKNKCKKSGIRSPNLKKKTKVGGRALIKTITKLNNKPTRWPCGTEIYLCNGPEKINQPEIRWQNPLENISFVRQTMIKKNKSFQGKRMY
jgi:hypothetical protein